MNNGWKYLPFEDCIEGVTYTSKVLRKNFLEDGEFPVISQEQDFVNGYWNNSNDVFRIKKPVVIFGDHTQVVKYVDFDFVLGADGVKIFQPTDEILPRYFYYFLVSVELRSLGYARHYRLLKEVIVPVPPIEEQRRIVAILDETFAAIDKAKANTERNIQNARELFDSYLNNIFSNPGPDWERKRIADICALKSGTTIPKSMERKAGDIPYVKVGDMNLPDNESEITTSSRFVNSAEISANQIIPEGSIIFPKRGGAIATNKKRAVKIPIIADLNTMAIIPGERLSPELFYHWFKLIDLNELSNGTSVPQINNYSFDDVFIPFPASRDEQKRLTHRLDELNDVSRELKAFCQNKIAELDELKKSILQRAFSGEL